jgi:O-antigen biosynthesis protein
MPTQASRAKFWHMALKFWSDQTHPNCELIVTCEDVDALRRMPVADGVRYVACPAFRTLGEKRNHTNSLARGEFIAHWDDDDYSHPDRLTDQVKRLIETGAAVTGYRLMDFTGNGKWLYRGAPDFVLGTSLMYRRDWWERNQFKAIQVGEDNDFVRRAAASNQLAVADGLGMMIARDHEANTSGRQRNSKQWERIG